MSIINSISNISKMNKQERIMRLIQLSVKDQFEFLDVNEMMEMAMIQSIRQENGEIDEVLKNRFN